MKNKNYNYGTAILSAFEYLLENYREVFIIGQGLWSPWYVGNTMTNLEKKFGVDRVIDTPVSESATTGAAIGALVGTLIVVFRLSSLVASLGVLFLLRGVILLLTNSRSITIMEVENHWLYPLLHPLIRFRLQPRQAR